MNEWCGIGRISNDLVLNKTANNQTTLTFNLAIDKRNRKKLEELGKPTTNFIRCVAWGSVAQTIADYCKKGTQLGIVGSIETRNYKDNDGKTVYVTEVFVGKITFCDNKPKNEFATVDDEANTTIAVDDSDLPF